MSAVTSRGRRRQTRVVLGVWDGHDAGVALMIDGEVRFALSEERLTRVKRQSGFPTQAIRACFEHTAIAPDEVDVVAVPGTYGRLLHRVGDGLYRKQSPNRDPLSAGSTFARGFEIGMSRLPLLRDVEAASGRALVARRLRACGVHAEVQLVDHHEAHAECARLCGFPDALVVTMDGYGDGLAATFSRRSRAMPRRELQSPMHSVALVYGAVSRVLGFDEGEEGKVMGLAARGNPDALQDWFESVLANGGCDPTLGGRERRRALLEHRREDVAAALQARTERLVHEWIDGHRDRVTRLAVAGGLFANATLNGSLRARFEAMYVFPHMGDGGLCIGAAAAQVPQEELRAMPLPFLGPTYDEQACIRAVTAAGLAPIQTDDPERELLDVIVNGGFAARFVGRSEFGPRALGHRSILCRADDMTLTATLNERLNRDGFMPFAPIRRSGAGTATMTAVVAADATLRSHCAAAVHVDGTARTQLVDASADPGLARLLERAESVGLPALINTSFNRHKEPIVETPEDAVATFLAAGLDIMQLGERLCVRRPASAT